MPQSRKRKREYMREYMRRRHGFSPRGAGKRDSKGNLVPPIKRRNLVPIPMNPVTMSKKKLVSYLAHVGRLGFSLVETSRGYELGANTGNLVPFDGVAVLESTLTAYGQRIMRLEGRLTASEARNTQAEADLARLEVMMASELREGDLL